MIFLLERVLKEWVDVLMLGRLFFSPVMFTKQAKISKVKAIFQHMEIMDNIGNN